MKITKLKAHFAPRTVSRVKARLAALGAIHAGKAQLKMEDAAYRALVSSASKGASESAADLDFRGRDRLIKAMTALGYKADAPLSARAKELSDRRLADLGHIHMGARALGLDEAAYRDLVEDASGGKTRSSANMNARERSKLLGEMRSQGFELDAVVVEPAGCLAKEAEPA